MNRAEVKARIETAYRALARVCESRSEADRLLDRAYRAAQWGERGHRKMGASFGKRQYPQSVNLAAMYFVVKWFREPHDVTDALSAVQLREDCLVASALRVLLAKELPVPELHRLLEALAPVADIDYSDHLAN